MSSSGLVPDPVPAGGKVSTDFSTNPTFAALGFSISDPHYYLYEVANLVGATCGHTAGITLYRLEAHGDLDGDAELSTFSMEVGVDAQGSLRRSPSFDVKNELE